MNLLFGGTSGTEYRIPRTNHITDEMYNILSNTKIQDSAINFRGVVAIFSIQNDTLPLYDIKMLQMICAK
jgi:hypothetical protein